MGLSAGNSGPYRRPRMARMTGNDELMTKPECRKLLACVERPRCDIHRQRGAPPWHCVAPKARAHRQPWGTAPRIYGNPKTSALKERFTSSATAMHPPDVNRAFSAWCFDLIRIPRALPQAKMKLRRWALNRRAARCYIKHRTSNMPSGAGEAHYLLFAFGKEGLGRRKS